MPARSATPRQAYAPWLPQSCGRPHQPARSRTRTHRAGLFLSLFTFFRLGIYYIGGLRQRIEQARLKVARILIADAVFEVLAEPDRFVNECGPTRLAFRLRPDALRGRDAELHDAHSEGVLHLIAIFVYALPNDFARHRLAGQHAADRFKLRKVDG